MRTVNRGSVSRPTVLSPSNELDRHIQAYAESGRKDGIRKSVYRHPDVESALRKLFFNKCSLCEAYSAKDGVVEHFIPHCPERAVLAYDWMNLHWTCEACNRRKSGDVYKDYRPGTMIVERTNLVDPTEPPGGRTEDIFYFNRRFEAEVTIMFRGNRIAKITADFLNKDPGPTDRNRAFLEMTETIAEWSCQKEWKALFDIDPIDPQRRPNEAHARFACEMADRLCTQFLAETEPFCTSLRSALADRAGLPFDKLARLGRWHRTDQGRQPIY